MKFLDACSAFMKKFKNLPVSYSLAIDDCEYNISHDAVKLICCGDVFGNDISGIDIPEKHKAYVLYTLEQGIQDEGYSDLNRAFYMMFENSGSDGEPVLLPIFLDDLDVNIKITVIEYNDTFNSADYDI